MKKAIERRLREMKAELAEILKNTHRTIRTGEKLLNVRLGIAKEEVAENGWLGAKNNLNDQVNRFKVSMWLLDRHIANIKSKYGKDSQEFQEVWTVRVELEKTIANDLEPAVEKEIPALEQKLRVV